MKLGLRRAALAEALIALFLVAGTPAAHADSNNAVMLGLTAHDVFISNHFYQHGKAVPADLNRLQGAVYAASQKGVTEKIALVWHFPANVRTTAQAAHDIRNYLDFTGILVLVSPRGIALSAASDDLSGAAMTSISRKSAPICLAQKYVSCAVYAANLATARAKANRDAITRNAAIFWIVVLFIFGVAILGIVVWNRRRRRITEVRTDELRDAASHTLSLADSAIADIEASAAQMAPDIRNGYDQALGLRNRASQELAASRTPSALTQSNVDAAQAVLALQGVMKQLGLSGPLSSPIDLPARRCFYCGREDRPPYIDRSIGDGQGNAMDVQICAVCAAELTRGQTPRVATAEHEGLVMPWWAVPSSPWYVGYGGPSWQYWLPFAVGMDIGGWYGGGYGSDFLDGNGSSPNGPTAQDSGGADWSTWQSGSSDSCGAGQMQPADAAGADWGDTGTWGGDSGDWGADSGGSDSGGSDFSF